MQYIAFLAWDDSIPLALDHESSGVNIRPRYLYSEVVLTGKPLKVHDSQLRKGPPLRNTIISVLFKFTVFFC